MTKQFTTGQIYRCRSIGDHNCVLSFEIVARSARFVSLRDSDGCVTRRKIRVVDGTERCDPQGVYSMAPVLTAE